VVRAAGAGGQVVAVGDIGRASSGPKYREGTRQEGRFESSIEKK
jgi:hypothetical protein